MVSNKVHYRNCAMSCIAPVGFVQSVEFTAGWKTGVEGRELVGADVHWNAESSEPITIVTLLIKCIGGVLWMDR